MQRIADRSLETVAVLALAADLAALVFGARWLTGVAVALLAVGLSWPGARRWLSSRWLRFASVAGAVNAKIVLGIVYMLVIVPLAICYRTFAKGAGGMRRPPGGAYGTWHERKHSFEADDMVDPW